MTTTKFCPECRTRQTVVDEFPDSIMDTRGEVGVYVWLFACGHSDYREGGVVNPDPTMGAAAPYAGPHRAVAASTKPADLRTARRRQDAIDNPWGDAGTWAP